VSVSQIINVVVNSKGAVTVKKQLDDIGNSAKTTTTYLNSMRAILAAALTFSGVGAITETIDNFTQLQNRLKLVTSEAEGTAAAWDRLMAIANGSYSTIDNTVNLYYRVAQAFKSWGESAEGAYEFTDKFQKAAILSGSTMQTTAQAVYQFSQALNKGKLDGDEFRSVLEGLPYVANIIQKSLGKTRAELYEMSKAGEITVDRIKQAFEEAAKTIESDWSKITPTIGMAMNIFRNNWTDFIGDIQNSTGIFSLVAQAIILVANNFHLLAAALTPVAATLAFMAGRLVLGLLVNGFKDMYAAITRVLPLLTAFNALLWTNPFVLAATLLAGIVAAVIYFRNELGLTNEVLSALWLKVTEVFTAIVSAINSVVAPIVEVVKNFVDWGAVMDNLRQTVSGLWSSIVSMFKAIISAAAQVGSYLLKEFKPVFLELWELVKAFASLVIELYKVYFVALSKAIEALLPVFKKVWEYIEPAMAMLINLIKEAFAGLKIIANWLKTDFLPIVQDVFEGWIILIRGVIGWVQKLIDMLKAALSLMSKVLSGGGGGGGPGANYGLQGYAGEFATGGSFKVGGTGAGRDTTPVSFRANRGERVTVETKKQQRINDAANQNVVPEVNVPVEIVNVLDPRALADALDTDYGTKRLVNVFKTNRDEFRAILGVN